MFDYKYHFVLWRRGDSKQTALPTCPLLVSVASIRIIKKNGMLPAETVVYFCNFARNKELPQKSMSTTLFYGCSWFNNIDPILVSLIGSSVKHVQCHLNAYVIDSCHDKTIHIELINITAEN